MATQTLKGTIRQTPGVVAEPPEKLYPGRSKLEKVLGDYQKASQDATEARSHLARAESDEAKALDGAASDSDDRLIVGQRSVGVYRARTASREKAQTALGKDLKDALRGGQQELNTLVMAVRDQRRGILASRIIEAGQLASDKLIASDLDKVLWRSKPLVDLYKWEVPAQTLLYLADTEKVVEIARQILSSFEGILTEQRRVI
jgi:hypothetical protein